MLKDLSIFRSAAAWSPRSFPTVCPLVFLIFVLAAGPQVPAGEKNGTFTLGKVELNLLDQCAALDQKFEKEGYIYSDPELTAYVEKVGRSVLPKGNPPERVQWRFRVVRDSLANAFALPNGSIYVHTGLLSLLENEAQLASVLSHEVIHVLNHHAFMLTRDIRKKSVAIHIISAVGAYVPVGGVAGVAVTVAANMVPFILVSTIYGYSRELEREADIEGFNRLSASGYDPREMSNAFKRLQKEFEVRLTKIYYNDHPKLQERMDYINGLIERQSSQGGASGAREIAREPYLIGTEKVAQQNVFDDIAGGRYRTAVGLAQKLVEFNPKSSRNLYCLAEAYRALGPRTPEPTAEELSGKGKKETKKLKNKLTLEEETATLMVTAAGQSAWQANVIKAEELYHKSLELDNTNVLPYSGLGFLYEKAQKPEKALEAYRKYLELRPDAKDQLRITRRIEALEKSPKLKTNQPNTEPR